MIKKRLKRLEKIKTKIMARPPRPPNPEANIICFTKEKIYPIKNIKHNPILVYNNFLTLGFSE